MVHMTLRACKRTAACLPQVELLHAIQISSFAFQAVRVTLTEYTMFYQTSQISRASASTVNLPHTNVYARLGIARSVRWRCDEMTWYLHLQAQPLMQVLAPDASGRRLHAAVTCPQPFGVILPAPLNQFSDHVFLSFSHEDSEQSADGSRILERAPLYLY